MTPDRVAVVGGGAVGVTAALELARAGVETHLYERGTIAESGASARAAGLCYDAHAGPTDASLAARALERFETVAASAETDLGLRRCPYVWLARDGDDRRAAAIREQVPRMRGHDRRVDLLDPGALASEFPALRAEDVAVAAVARDAVRLDPAAYVRAVADRAADAGAVVHEGTRVVLGADSGGDGPTLRAHPESEADDPPSVDAVLVAAGAHTADVLDRAGVAVPVVPYRVQALVGRVGADERDGAGSTGDRYATDATAARADPHPGPMVYDATEGFYCRPHPAGVLAGDGTEERAADPETYRREADPGFPATLAERVGWRLDAAVTAERAWAGLCTATPDRDPLLGRVAPGVYVATGWQGSGFMRAPATGEVVARAVREGERAPVDPYDPARFDGSESVDVREGMVIEE